MHAVISSATVAHVAVHVPAPAPVRELLLLLS